MMRRSTVASRNELPVKRRSVRQQRRMIATSTADGELEFRSVNRVYDAGVSGFGNGNEGCARRTDGILGLLLHLLDGVHVRTLALVLLELLDSAVPRFPDGIDAV